MNALLIVLRWLHIVAGVYWVGAGLMTTFIISPAVMATGDAGKQFMGHLMTKTKFSLSMMIASIISMTAGFILFFINAKAPGWAASSTGMGFSIGAVFAIIALTFGMMVPATSRKLGALGAQIQGKPTAEQAAELQSLSKRMMVVSYINVTCLLLAVTFMAIARFL